MHIRTLRASTGELSYTFLPSQDGGVEIWARTPVNPEWAMIGTAKNESEGERVIQRAAYEADVHLSGSHGRALMAGARAGRR